MSAAMMVQIAAVLKVDVQYFFDELPTGVQNTKENQDGLGNDRRGRPQYG
jgi:hypothetical protein